MHRNIMKNIEYLRKLSWNNNRSDRCRRFVNKAGVYNRARQLYAQITTTKMRGRVQGCTYLKIFREFYILIRNIYIYFFN